MYVVYNTIYTYIVYVYVPREFKMYYQSGSHFRYKFFSITKDVLLVTSTSLIGCRL